MNNKSEEKKTYLCGTKSKQGREVLEKKKQNKNRKKQSGKKLRQRPRPHHPSKKGHRKYW